MPRRARMLRGHAELVGLKPNFTILDADDQIRLVKQLQEARNDRHQEDAAPADDVGDPALEGSRPHPGSRHRGGGRRSRRRPGAAALPRVPGAAAGAERRRFRRPAAARAHDLSRAPGSRGEVSAAVPLRAGGRVPGHQRRAVPLAAGCWRSGTAISAASATTTSRSTPGAAPRSATSCASSATFRARGWSAWSATTAPRRTSWPPHPG